MPFNKPEPLQIRRINQETPKVKSFLIRSKEIASEAKPGQFVMVSPFEPIISPLNPRDEVPIAIASVWGDEFEIAVTKVGDCTEALHKKRVGDYIGGRGPYGNHFALWGNHVLDVVGGYGAAGTLYTVGLFRSVGIPVTVAMGADTKDNLLYRDAFNKIGCKVHVTTEDGSDGRKGIVTDLLPELFETGIDSVITCGPELMMYVTIMEAYKRGIPSQVSNERITKCAVGICGACDLGGGRTCKEYHILTGEQALKTEFGKVKRDKSGRRIPLIEGRTIWFDPLEVLEPRSTPLLETEIAGLYFPNPVTNGSGAGFSSAWLHRLAKAGAGAIVTKSIGPYPVSGYNGPNMIEYKPDEWVNAMGLPNPGMYNYVIEMRELKPALKKSRVPVIVSIFGTVKGESDKGDKERLKLESVGSYRNVALRAVDYGADALEINPSCPHSNLSAVEADPEFLKKVTEVVVEVAHREKVPVSVKLSPNIDYITSAKAAVEAGADSIVLTNTLRCRPTYDLPGFRTPILGNPSGFGGGSWKAVAKKSEQALIDAYRELDVPIISVGGIFSGNIVDRFLLGASACQMATVFAYEPPEKVFPSCISALERYIRSENYDNITEIIGTDSKR